MIGWHQNDTNWENNQTLFSTGLFWLLLYGTTPSRIWHALVPYNNNQNNPVSIEWYKNDIMRVERGGKKSKGLTFVQNFPSALRKLSLWTELNSVQSDNFLIPCGRDPFFLIYSHQKWWNEFGMGVKKLNSQKNISHSFLIPSFLEASSQSPHHPLQRMMGGLAYINASEWLVMSQEWYH